LFDKKLSVDETVKTTQIEKLIVDKVHKLNINSEHKRLPTQKPDR
jgi:NAD+ synthase